MRAHVVLFLIGLPLVGGCLNTRGSQPDATAGAGQVAASQRVLEERVEEVGQALDRLDDRVRRSHAERSAQLDAILAQLSRLEAKIAAQDQQLSRLGLAGPSAAGLAAQGRELPGGWPASEGPVAYLDSPAGTLPGPGPEAGDPGAVDISSSDPLLPLLPATQRAATENAVQGSLGAVGAEPTSPPAEGGPGTIPRASAEAVRLYEIAYQELMRENYQLALINFRTFLDSYPGTHLSDNAQYWIGEVYYAQGQHEQGIEEFRRVIEDYAGQDKVPAAYYKIALCFLQLKDTATARRYLEHLRRQFPGTREAQLAEAKLGEL